jgi:diaminohydroxyphosphoribosylaminopyrimidine deaminase/5-amino-6-(5-phosphoribosylamino)uracil reductase
VRAKNVTRIDERHMRRVLALAARARGRTGPNPMVGAVVARGGTVVGEGYHARAGAPHAEVVALSQAGARARGATLYVNLEPCCHHGRTPPCTDAILAAGVVEVVASMRDPDPRVDGRGIRALRAARVKVRVGTLRTEAERLNEGFVKFRRTRRPFVTLKAGMSLDGRIATRGGESKWITSRAARAAARRLRGEHEAVVIGVGTVLSDDPRLTGPRTNGAGGRARREGPARVVLDTRLRTPATARMLRSAGGPVMVIAGRGASVDRRRRLERAGALVVGVPTRSGRVDLRAAIRELGRRGVATVLIEGGGEVLGAALDAGIGDRVALFVAPRLLGGRTARPAFGGGGAARLADAARVEGARPRRIGDNWVIEARLRHPGRRRRG